MRNCYKCNAEVKENAKFCPNCGATLRCPECGEELHGEKFCSNCGRTTERTQGTQSGLKVAFSAVGAKFGAVGAKVKAMDRKKIRNIIIIAVLLLALILGLSIGIPISKDTFRKAKVSKIEIGMTQDEVKEILGEPHEEGRGGGFWTYYEKKAKKQIEKMSDDFFDSDSLEDAFDGLDKSYSKLAKMSYKSIVVEFGGKDGTVSSVALNKNTKYDEPLFGANYESQKPKELKEISLSKSTVGIGTNIRNEGIYYTAEFKDGSYRKALISDWSGFSTADAGRFTHKFSDEWAEYSVKINLKKNNLLVESENEELGTVKGSGYYAVGEVAELTAYPIGEDIILGGWYDKNGELLSKENPFYYESKSIDITTQITAKFFKVYIFPDNITITNNEVREINWEKFNAVVIPESVTSIGMYAFSKCTRLTSIVIPNSVTSIRNHAFSGCRCLTNIYYGGTVSEWKSINKEYYWDDYTGNYKVYCTDGAVAKDGKVTYY